MRIVGFNITKVSAERKSPVKGKLEIKSNINIKDITTEEIPIAKNPALKFDFEFVIEFNPKIANIEIAGSVLVLDEENQSKEIIKLWKKKKFDHPLKIGLFNFIMEKCNLKALQLEDELSLPMHINMPKLVPKSQQENTNPANYAG